MDIPDIITEIENASGVEIAVTDTHFTVRKAHTINRVSHALGLELNLENAIAAARVVIQDVRSEFNRELDQALFNLGELKLKV